MSVDYDLVVIGSSQEGIYAAATAVRLRARVALVTQSMEENSYSVELLFSHSLAQIAHFVRINQENVFGIYSQPIASSVAELTEARNWSQAVNSALTRENALTTLAAQGVDIIYDRGEFCRLPQLALIVGKRKLRSRTYLVATGACLVTQPEVKQQNCSYLTLEELNRREDLGFLPKQVTVVGGSPSTLVLAQSLARLGRQVVLILEGKRLLPCEDTEAAMLIQAQLEAEGVKILTSSPVTQIKNLEGKKWLQVGDRALETEEIIFTGKKQPNISGLNLEGVGVSFTPQGIQVNEILQTGNPNIYACGDVLGGYSLPQIAQYEANIALKNALFVPCFKKDYAYLPWAIFTRPNLARVGMTESQARHRYDNHITIVRQYSKKTTQAQLSGNTTGLSKFLIRTNGEIVGAHLVGENTAELIGAIALFMKSKLKLSQNPILGLLKLEFPYIYPGFAEIMQQTATAFHQQQLARSKHWRRGLKTWFDLCRK